MKNNDCYARAVHCPHCQSPDVKKHGTSSNGKRCARCLNLDCPDETCSQSIDYPGRRREVKQQIVEMTLNGSGVRAIARVLHVSTATIKRLVRKTICFSLDRVDARASDWTIYKSLRVRVINLGVNNKSKTLP